MQLTYQPITDRPTGSREAYDMAMVALRELGVIR